MSGKCILIYNRIFGYDSKTKCEKCQKLTMRCYFLLVFSKDLWLMGEYTTVSFTFDCYDIKVKLRKNVKHSSKAGEEKKMKGTQMTEELCYEFIMLRSKATELESQSHSQMSEGGCIATKIPNGRKERFRLVFKKVNKRFMTTTFSFFSHLICYQNRYLS